VSLDHETDAIIQNTLRRELGSDVTVLTIAHRLQTIMDADRIVSLPKSDSPCTGPKLMKPPLVDGIGYW
jgi:ABC-type multidrug transport system fused ATPase/permease subunit